MAVKKRFPKNGLSCAWSWWDREPYSSWVVRWAAWVEIYLRAEIWQECCCGSRRAKPPDGKELECWGDSSIISPARLEEMHREARGRR